MSTVIKTYIGIFVFVFSLAVMTGLMKTSMDTNKARDFYDIVIAEIENSNFAPSVVAACEEQAKASGYELMLNDTGIIKDADGRVVLMEVILKYQYEIPFFGINENKYIRGFAR